MPFSGSQVPFGRSVVLFWARAEERRGLKCDYRFYTALEFLQREGGSSMVQYTPFYLILEAFGGDLNLWVPAPVQKNSMCPTFPTIIHCASRVTRSIAVFPILADPVDVKKGDRLCETVSQPSIQPDKVDPPMGS